MLTTQQAHDQIFQYFSRPGASFSIDLDEEACWYRHPEDPTTMCGVGILIPADMYSSGMEGAPVSAILDDRDDVRFSQELSDHLRMVNVSYLDQVQSKHDEIAKEGIKDGRFMDDPDLIGNFLFHLQEIASQYGMTTDWAGAKAAHHVETVHDEQRVLVDA